MGIINFKEKLILTTVVCIVVMTPYFLVQRFPLHTHPFKIPELLIDQKISFWSHSFWVYQSLYAMLLSIAFGIKNKYLFYKYSIGIMLIGLFCSIIFYFFPSYCPRPEYVGANWVYKLFIEFELPSNAFPSMHVALAFFSLCFCFNYFKQITISKYLILIWTILIIVSTLLLKQHFFLDVIGGLGMALLVFFLKYYWIKLIPSKSI